MRLPVINDYEHKLDCLARWMLNHWQTKPERQASLARMAALHGESFITDLKRRMMVEVKNTRNKL